MPSAGCRVPDFDVHPLIYDWNTVDAPPASTRPVLLDDESALIKEMLVLTFGEAWRVDIENLLDFEI